jgi:hypothetical protein
MSSYTRSTQHPITGKIEVAEWLDDYFGSHKYGIKFPDGKIFKAEEFIWQINLMEDIVEIVKAPIHPTIEINDNVSINGLKTVEEIKHPDGSQDVKITVNRLNLENRTEEDTEAEKKIVEALLKKVVNVIILDKATNNFANFKSPISQVRNRAEEVIRRREEKKFNINVSNYVIFEIDGDSIKLSQL